MRMATSTRFAQRSEADATLANAAWDWGGGDWETGLGAAAHMGRRDIAELLLAHGARIDVFAAAMLDQVEIVRAMLAVLSGARAGRAARHPAAEARRGRREQRARVLELLAAASRRRRKEPRRATSARPRASRRSRARRLPSRR